jgi:GT2 family glycosyltransferase
MDESFQFKMNIIPSRGNIGFSAGVNFAHKFAEEECRADAFLLINPDGFMHNDFLTHLLDVDDCLNDKIIEGAQFPTEHPKFYDRTTRETPWASFCCCLIGSHVFSKLNGLDERFFLYMEDVDFSFRARLHGFKIYFEPRALFYHCDINRPNSPNSKRQKFNLASSYLLAEKWGHTALKQRLKRALKHQHTPIPDFDDDVRNLTAAERTFFRNNYPTVSESLRWS